MIEFAGTGGQAVFVNPDRVRQVEAHHSVINWSLISFDVDHYTIVEGTPVQIVAKLRYGKSA